MKKQLWLIAAAVVVVLAIAGSLVWWQAAQQKNSAANSSDSQNTSYAEAKDACAYLTQEIATKLLGAGAEKGDINPPAASDDISVSTCTYSSKVGDSLADIKNMRIATLLVRSPLSAVGAASNDEPFDNLKNGAITVGGYGEKAYWDPELGQLNVLKGGTWLILSFGQSAIADKSLDEAKQLANEIVPQL